MPFSNHIEGFFDHRYCWKESVYSNVLDFLQGDHHPTKVASETTTFD